MPRSDDDRHRRVADPAALVRILALCLLAVGLVVTPMPTAPDRPARAATAPQEMDLEEYPKQDPDDLPEKYREWLEEEVTYIITDEEREVFLRCPDDATRDRFMERFWEVRDPTPGTPENEYKELHYERLAYANRHFGRDTPRKGWQTDKGRMYILLGEPMSITRLPNTQLVYPAEIWFYHANPELGIPAFFNLMFFKDRGMGEYRLYSPVADGPRKLLNPAGELRLRDVASGGNTRGRLGGSRPGGMLGFADTEAGAIYEVLLYVDPDLAQAALSLLPNQHGGPMLGRTSLRSELLLGQIQNIPNKVMPNAQWAYRVLTGSTEAEVRYETLPAELEATALVDPSGVPFIHFGFQTQGNTLNLRQYEDSYYITFDLSGSVVDSQQRVVRDMPTRTMQRDVEQDVARDLRSNPVLYLDRLPVVPGSHTFSLVVENNVSREFARSEFRLQVPGGPRPESLRSSKPVLAARYQRAQDHDPYREQLPFQIGPHVVLPAIGGSFESGSTAHVFHQVYVPADRTETIRAIYTIRGEDGTLVERTVRLDPADADSYGTLNQVASFELADFPAGDYELVVDIEEDGDPPASLDLRVAQRSEEEKSAGEGKRDRFVHAEIHPPATDPGVRIDLARQYRKVGKPEPAIALLRDVIARDPDNTEAVDLQADLLMDVGRFEELDELLAPRLVENPNDIEALMALAEANANLGNHYDAIRYYERARIAGREDDPELLNSLAAEYFHDGRMDKAKEILEESLALQPDQTDVQRLLDEVTRRQAATSSTESSG